MISNSSTTPHPSSCQSMRLVSALVLPTAHHVNVWTCLAAVSPDQDTHAFGTESSSSVAYSSIVFLWLSGYRQAQCGLVMMFLSGKAITYNSVLSGQRQDKKHETSPTVI